ncbi:type I DNA topoisomerase [bacterium]|nr:type I DNA topoisomerase [bacterium]
MAKNLVIVESPAKAKTIEKYLGKDFKVEASYGHVRDLPRGDLGIDVENDFEPRYVIPTKSRKRVNALKKEVEKFEKLYLAPDPDREGEAIAWHIAEIVKEKFPNPERVVFTEITETAVKEAFNKPREIDERLVDAQQGRRVLDRLVGYKLSPLLWKKVRRGLSAGRVQSIAVRLIVERERERDNFKQQEYWQIEVELSKNEQQEIFIAKLYSENGKALKKLSIENSEQAKKIEDAIIDNDFIVEKIEEKETNKNPYPPFTTSTLQQAASRILGFSAKKTMLVAQKLYEGISLGSDGSVGLITYMRTDSFHLSQDFINNTQEFIKEKFGKEFSVEGGKHYKSKAKNAQEAHEAIRPTYITKSPESIEQYLDKDQLKLYRLIHNRALSSQMASAKVLSTGVFIKNGVYGFKLNGSRVLFEGFLKVSGKAKDGEQLLPKFDNEEKLDLHKISPIQSFTQPPARYSEASLVKAMEENGIGRPSTYAPTMSTIVDRGYVIKEAGYFVPESIAYTVNDGLVKCFPELVDISFTAKMEEELDDIAQGTSDWKTVIKDFYTPFEKDLSKVLEKEDSSCFGENKIEYIKPCPTCQETKCTSDKSGEKKPHWIIERYGRFGKFMGCTCYPDCKHIEKAPDKEVGVKCPVCGGNIIIKRTRRGKVFYGCSSYPTCTYALWYKPVGEDCPQCKKPLVQKGKNIACSECDYKKAQ